MSDSDKYESKKIFISDELNKCESCDFVSDFYANYKGECVCPQCMSTDYYIVEDDKIEMAWIHGSWHQGWNEK